VDLAVPQLRVVLMVVLRVVAVVVAVVVRDVVVVNAADVAVVAVVVPMRRRNGYQSPSWVVS